MDDLREICNKMPFSVRHVKVGDKFYYHEWSDIPWTVIKVDANIGFKRHNGIKTYFPHDYLAKLVLDGEMIPILNGLEIACRKAKAKNVL